MANESCIRLVRGLLPLGSPSRRDVLMTLASYADANGYCWPGLDTLSADTERDERTVRRCLQELNDSGWIVMHKRSVGTLHRGTSYTLNLSKLRCSQRPRPGTAPGDTADTTPGDAGTTGHDAHCTADTTPGEEVATGHHAHCTPDTTPEKVGATPGVLELPRTPKENEVLSAPAGNGVKRTRAINAPVHSTALVGGSAASAKKDPASAPNFAVVKALIFDYYRHANNGDDPEWDVMEAANLSRLLKSRPNAAPDHWHKCLVNRWKSESVSHSERPGKWNSNLSSYAAGPLNGFNKPKGTEHAGFKGKTGRSVDAAKRVIASLERRDDVGTNGLGAIGRDGRLGLPGSSGGLG